MGMRILLLLTISWIVGLTAPVFTINEHRVLVARPDPDRRRSLPAVEGDDRDRRIARGRRGRITRDRRQDVDPSRSVLVQIVLLDIVFSLDSVLTAVGMAERDRRDDRGGRDRGRGHARGVGTARGSSHDHPSVKMLALAFLLLIGVTLVADGFGFHIDKAYIYAAMALQRLRGGAQPAGSRRRKKTQAGGAAPDVRQGRGGGRRAHARIARQRSETASSVSPTSGGTHRRGVRLRVRPEVPVVVGAAGGEQAERDGDLPDSRDRARRRRSGSAPRGRRGPPR